MSSALSRTAEVFDLLASSPKGLSVTELAQQMGASKSTASRLLAALVEADLVERDMAQRHFLAARFWGWGVEAVRRLAVLDVSRPHVAAAVRNLSVSVFTAVARGGQTLYLECASERAGEVRFDQVSHVVPVYACAPGKAMLAHSDEATIDAVLAGTLLKFTRYTHATREDLAAELEAVRRQGYAVNRGEYQDNGRLAAAVPVFDQAGRAGASVCFFGFTDEAKMLDLVPALVSLGEMISVSLGYSRAARELAG